MAAAWTEQQQHPDMATLAFDERFGLLVEAEWSARENKRLARALTEAKLKLISYCYLAVALAAIGDFSRAVAAAEEGARLSLASATVGDRLWVLYGQSFPAVTRGQYTTALPSLEKGLSLARDLNLSAWRPVFAGYLGYVYARTGRLEEGLRLLDEATIQAETSNRNAWAGNLYRQSEALLLAARPRDARAVAQRGLDGARARGERRWESSCLRALGKLSRRTGKRFESDEHFTTAMTMYREMDMKYWLEQAEAELSELG